MAGVRSLEDLLEVTRDLYDITVFGAEPCGNYNRILLSAVLAGEKTFNEIILHDRAWYEDNDIRLLAGRRVIHIDRAQRRVIADDGSCAEYDRLILATGSTPIVLPVPGSDLPGVVTFRRVHDVQVMLEHSKTHRNAVVIGAGLLGLEAAHGLLEQGMKVSVVHLCDHLMERQLDEAAATMLRRSLEQRGLTFQMGARATAIVGNDRVEAVQLHDGTRIDASLVVMAVGVRPNIELADEAGLRCERGVLVSDTMQTYDPRIYAVGECVQHRGSTFGSVAPLFEQAKVVANQLAEDGYYQYRGSTASTRLKVTGIDLFSAGNHAGGKGCEELVLQDAARGVYRKLVLRGDRVEGAVLYGDTSDAAWYLELIKTGQDVASLRERLLVGRRAAEGDEGSDLASLPDETRICDCNGVCKGAIVRAIQDNNLCTLAQVKAHTKAGASCGGCSELVDALLQMAVGDDYARPETPSICECTDLGHDALREAILERELKAMEDVMRALTWKSADGCAKCRPAINYYLVCAWPDSYEGDSLSRHVNERVHANIQKDGSFSVVPRMFAGITTPDQLRAIADVADRFQIPSVKLTGGQRIALFGVKKEELPAVWAELGKAGLISGHAYGKSLRTVKSCVGAEWCRFGLQHSMAMASELEQMSWGTWTPHKFKMAVSGCPRNCAEAAIKDLGVVGIESGWELQIGGNGGIRARIADVLCRLATNLKVLEHAAAFLQLYREEARYLERTAQWIERAGIAYIKDRVVRDKLGRRALAARFHDSQRNVQVDPWAARAEGAEAHEFAPLCHLIPKTNPIPKAHLIPRGAAE